MAFVISMQVRADPGWLERLHSSDIAVRRAAMDEVQTLDDPRIPGECFALLDDEGESIRRLAARAIGSRFDQIPKRLVKDYIEALRWCGARGPEDVALMCKRAEGLLARDYSSDAFSTSPDGKWVLYERRRLPVIANVKRREHTLLSPVMPGREYWGNTTCVRDGNIVPQIPPHRGAGLLKLMITNAPVENLFVPSWQPRSLAVAFSPIVQMKFFHPVCIWRADDGALRVWTVESFLPLLRGRFPHWSTTMDFEKWDGPVAVMRIYDCDDGGGGAFDPQGVHVSVDIRTWKLAVVQ
ncbi:MAG: HEAT repeat domain-containing protein [Chthoniobacterales bacterium]